MQISVDAVNVMAAYQPVVLTCVHCGGRTETDLGDVLKVAWYVGYFNVVCCIVCRLF